MPPYSKGVKNRELLLSTAKKLFFEQGYDETTTRQLAECSGLNLGLIKYYYESKANIALAIYTEIRQVFDDYLTAQNYHYPEIFLMGSAVEFIVCANSPGYHRFYTQIYHEPAVQQLFQSKIIQMDHSNLPDEAFYRLNSVAFSFMKPNLISFSKTPEGEKIELRQYIQYYMKQQVFSYQFPEGQALADRAFEELRKHYFNVVENFIPVMSRIAD